MAYDFEVKICWMTEACELACFCSGIAQRSISFGTYFPHVSLGQMTNNGWLVPACLSGWWRTRLGALCTASWTSG